LHASAEVVDARLERCLGAEVRGLVVAATVQGLGKECLLGIEVLGLVVRVLVSLAIPEAAHEPGHGVS
jgi:hypothetical protein